MILILNKKDIRCTSFREAPQSFLILIEKLQVLHNWFNPELLSAYIVSLQAQDAQKPNRVLETYLKSLIQESNKMLGTKVNPKYQSPAQQPGQNSSDKVKQDKRADNKMDSKVSRNLIFLLHFHIRAMTPNSIELH